MHIQMIRLYEAARKLTGQTSQGEIARLLNQSSQVINNWEARGISKGGMLIAQAKIGCSATWLATGTGSMELVTRQPGDTAPTADFDTNVRIVTGQGRAIPVISAVQAGAMTDMEAPYEPGDGFDIIYTDDELLSAFAFGLEIEGLSMMPEFRPGDRVIIDPEVAPNPGDFVVAKNGGNQATFKKYRPRGVDDSGNEIFELVPLNEDFASLRSDATRLQVIGVMTEHRKLYRRKGQ